MQQLVPFASFCGADCLCASLAGTSSDERCRESQMGIDRMIRKYGYTSTEEVTKAVREK